MNDNFLYQNRPPVRQGFGESLYLRISDLPLKKGTSRNRLRFALRFAVVSMILFTVLFNFSQPVRASVLHWLKEIAGFVIEERDAVSTAVSEGSLPSDYHRNLLEDVVDLLPYKLALPTYVPEGFVVNQHVEKTGDSIFMRWMNEDGDEILMMVDTDHGQRYVTGTDAAWEIEVNGQPAMMIQGGYDSDNVWDDDFKMMNIVQRRDDAVYWLIYIELSDGVFDGEAIQNELIYMMSSLEN